MTDQNRPGGYRLVPDSINGPYDLSGHSPVICDNAGTGHAMTDSINIAFRPVPDYESMQAYVAEKRLQRLRRMLMTICIPVAAVAIVALIFYILGR